MYVKKRKRERNRCIRKRKFYWFELTRLRNLYRLLGVCFLKANDDFCRTAIGLAGIGDDGAYVVPAEVVFNWLIIRFEANG
jgi:hypothetical protein